MTPETPSRISLCFNQIQIYVPRSLADIARARKLLNMLEAEIEEGEIVERTETRNKEEQPAWSREAWLKDLRNKTQESPLNKQDLASIPIQTEESQRTEKYIHALKAGYPLLAQVYSAPEDVIMNTHPHAGGYGEPSPDCKCRMCEIYRDQLVLIKKMSPPELSDYENKLVNDVFYNKDAYTRFVNYMWYNNGVNGDYREGLKKRKPEHENEPPIKPHTVAHGVIPSQIEDKPISAGERGQIDTQTSEAAEKPLNQIVSVPVNFFIPKFKWDKTKEKSYRMIFFFEHEDGERVMIFYLNSRIFTTKAAVMTIPYPVPYNYEPLRSIQNNKRTAFKFYREYLAKEAASHELVRWKDKNNQDKGIFEDILLHEAENKDEDEIMSDVAKDAEEKRLEKLKKTAEVNKDRWKVRVENEASPRTKELREKFAFGLLSSDKS